MTDTSSQVKPNKINNKKGREKKKHTHILRINETHIHHANLRQLKQLQMLDFNTS